MFIATDTHPINTTFYAMSFLLYLLRCKNRFSNLSVTSLQKIFMSSVWWIELLCFNIVLDLNPQVAFDRIPAIGKFSWAVITDSIIVYISFDNEDKLCIKDAVYYILIKLTLKHTNWLHSHKVNRAWKNTIITSLHKKDGIHKLEN